MVLTFKDIENYDPSKVKNVIMFFKPKQPEINTKVLNFIQTQYDKDTDCNKRKTFRETYLNKDALMNTYELERIASLYGEDIANEIISAMNAVLDGADAIKKTQYTINMFEDLKKIVK